MSLTQPIMNLEKTDSIPQGSTFVVEMGDGSGTKAVTKENLEKSTGETLKIGNLEDLQTEEKSSIVAAINEAAQSGGGSVVDILDTKEEIEANTETGKAAGAQAVKAMFGELNDNLASGQISFSVVDGEPYVKVGADAARPFLSSTKLSETFSFPPTQPYQIRQYTATFDFPNGVDGIVEVLDADGNIATDTSSGKLCGFTINKNTVTFGFIRYASTANGSTGGLVLKVVGH